MTDYKALIERLEACANDPMWADHAEVSKHTLTSAAQALRDLEAENARLKASGDAMAEALREIVEHCANAGLPNEIVADRVVDRCDETARAALAQWEKQDGE